MVVRENAAPALCGILDMDYLSVKQIKPDRGKESVLKMWCPDIIITIIPDRYSEIENRICWLPGLAADGY